MKEIHGVLHAFAETGTEGAYWSFLEDGFSGYDALRVLDDGDHLTIYDESGEVVFDDLIKQDKTTGRQPRPFNPDFKQQVALGRWIHWIQEGWDPDEWAELFMSDKTRAKLVKKDKEETTEHIIPTDD